MRSSAFPKFSDAIGDIRRFRFVVTVLFEEGFSFLVDETKLHYLVPLRARFFWRVKSGAQVVGIRTNQVPPEVRLRRALERLGPTFMKLGQLLSVRPDIVPPEYIKELAKLQDSGPVMSPGVAEKIVEDEMGLPIENIFESFEVRPVAAASLAQVHRAKLRDGTAVAVKVRRPGIDEIVRTDIHILTYIAQLLEKHLPYSRRFHPVRVAREFADWTLREIDFEIEGAHMDMFRESFATMPDVVIPKVHWDFTSQAVLVSDLLEGVKVDDLEALDKAQVDRHELALIGLRSGLHMFLVDGFFHGDPHPGNLVVLPAEKGENGQPLRLGMYDFGMVGRITEKYRFVLIGCFVSFLERNPDAYIKHVLDLAEREEDADEAAFTSQARTIMTGIIHKPNEKKGVAHAFYRILMSGAKNGIIFPADLVLLAKAFVTIENTGLRLWPEIDLEKELRPYLTQVMKEEFNPKKVIADFKTSAFDTLYFMRHLPEQTQALLERLDRGEVGVKLNLQELRDLKEEFDRQNDVRVLALLAVSLLLASAVVLRLDVQASALGVSLGQIGFLVAVVIVLWLFVLIRKKP